MDLKVSSKSCLKSIKTDKTDTNGDISFKNGYALSPVSHFMNLAANSDTFNTTVLDMVGMVIPRTLIDAKRNEHAKLETFRREIMGTVTNCLTPGLVAFSVGIMVYPFLKMKTTLLANDETIDVLEEAWKNAEGTGREKTKNYVKNVLNGVEGLEGEQKWNILNGELNSEKAEKDILSKMVDLIENKKDKENIVSRIVNVIKKSDEKKALEAVENSIGQLIQARNTVKVTVGDKKAETNLGHLLRDIRDVGEHIFKKFDGDNLKTAIQKTKKLNNVKALTALGLIGAIDLAVQFVNRHMTAQKTGKKGFVGYKDYKDCDVAENDPKKKRNLLIKKGLAMLALGILAKKTINLDYKKGLTENLKKLQFQKMFPTMNQIKILYTATVAGRLLAAEDSNEFRESVTRDFFSYINWLVLGNVVTKAIVWNKDKEMINISKPIEEKIQEGSFYDKAKNKSKRFFDWINNTSVKTHHEVIDMSNIKENNLEKYSEEVIKNKIKLLNKATGAGLLYSTIMLGIGIPVINIFLTDKRRKEELAAKQNESCKTVIPEKKYDNQLFAAFIK